MRMSPFLHGESGWNTVTSDSHRVSILEPWLSLTGVIASVRFFFAFFGGFERNRGRLKSYFRFRRLSFTPDFRPVFPSNFKLTPAEQMTSDTGFFEGR